MLLSLVDSLVKLYLSNESKYWGYIIGTCYIGYMFFRRVGAGRLQTELWKEESVSSQRKETQSLNQNWGSKAKNTSHGGKKGVGVWGGGTRPKAWP